MENRSTRDPKGRFAKGYFAEQNWSEGEDSYLDQKLREGKSWSLIAANMGKSVAAIQIRRIRTHGTMSLKKERLKVDGWFACRKAIIEFIEREAETWTPNGVQKAVAEALIKKIAKIDPPPLESEAKRY